MIAERTEQVEHKLGWTGINFASRKFMIQIILTSFIYYDINVGCIHKSINHSYSMYVCNMRHSAKNVDILKNEEFA